MDVLEYVLNSEGGYVNHKNDRGGETYKGIARNFWGNWEGWPLIDRMDRGKYRTDREFTEALEKLPKLNEKVAAFYKKEFWDRMRLDEVKSDKIKLLMMDFGVNFGHKRAVKYAQICSGAFVDSLIGPKTIAAINSTDGNKFCYQFLMECMEGYYSLVQRNDSQRVFFFGWIGRVVRAYYKVRE